MYLKYGSPIMGIDRRAHRTRTWRKPGTFLEVWSSWTWRFEFIKTFFYFHLWMVRHPFCHHHLISSPHENFVQVVFLMRCTD